MDHGVVMLVQQKHLKLIDYLSIPARPVVRVIHGRRFPSTFTSMGHKEPASECIKLWVILYEPPQDARNAEEEID